MLIRIGVKHNVDEIDIVLAEVLVEISFGEMNFEINFHRVGYSLIVQTTCEGTTSIRIIKETYLGYQLESINVSPKREFVTEGVQSTHI